MKTIKADNMKRIAFFSITLLLACMAGCDNKIPMEENLWPETVYLVGAKDKIINRDLNIGYEKDTYFWHSVVDDDACRLCHCRCRVYE